MIALVEVTSKSWHPEEKVHKQQARLRVLHAFKGTRQNDELTVSFGRVFTCGATFYRPGQYWLVFLDKDDKSNIYGTCNYQYGQMKPWEALLARVQQMTAPGSKIPSTIAAGAPGVESAVVLSAQQWAKLRIGRIGLGMSRDEVRKLPSEAQGEPRFDRNGRVDLVEGGVLMCDGSRLMRALDEQEAASGLGTPRETIGQWKLYGSSPPWLAIEFRRELISYFVLASTEAALRNRVRWYDNRSGRKRSQLPGF